MRSKTIAILMCAMAAWLYSSYPTMGQTGYEIPKPRKNDKVIRREAYTLSFNEYHHLANWVAYVLTAGETVARVNRFDGVFTPDPDVDISPDNLDYQQSGYDRGHLAPAADMEFSYNTMQESFYFSNIAPQAPAFNRGIWKRLEILQRMWANQYDSIYIVTGPVLKGKLGSIGEHGVSVPKYFYKVIMRTEKDGRHVAIGFVLPNKDSQAKLRNKAVSVDSVEAFTGIDFFHQLPDKEEKAMECVTCAECWDWHSGDPRVEVISGGRTQNAGNRPNQFSQKLNQPSTRETQCKGTTKAGRRCRRMTTDPSGFCYQHKRK